MPSNFTTPKKWRNRYRFYGSPSGDTIRHSRIILFELESRKFVAEPFRLAQWCFTVRPKFNGTYLIKVCPLFDEIYSKQNLSGAPLGALDFFSGQEGRKRSDRGVGERGEEGVRREKSRTFENSWKSPCHRSFDPTFYPRVVPTGREPVRRKPYERFPLPDGTGRELGLFFPRWARKQK